MLRAASLIKEKEQRLLSILAKTRLLDKRNLKPKRHVLRGRTYKAVQSLSINSKKFVNRVFEHQKFRLQERTGWNGDQRTETVLRLPNQVLFKIFLDTVGGGVTVGVWTGSKLGPLEE
jgi:hypothetical protein